MPQSDSLEAIFHRQLVVTGGLTKRQQGYVMGAFREAYWQCSEKMKADSFEDNSVEVRVEDLIDLLAKLPMDKKILIGNGHMVAKELKEDENETQTAT